MNLRSAALMSLSVLGLAVSGRAAEPPLNIAESLTLGGKIRRVVQPPAVCAESLPVDAANLVQAFDAESKEMRAKVEQEIHERRLKLIIALQALQDSYTREARLDEAVAIRDTIRQLKAAHFKIQENPGNMSRFSEQIGESFYFEVVGRTDGSLWGTELYTYDSDIATAAVHMGVLKPGQKGIVKVTMCHSENPHRSSVSHGVSSSDWGPYPASFTVQMAVPDRNTGH